MADFDMVACLGEPLASVARMTIKKANANCPHIADEAVGFALRYAASNPYDPGRGIRASTWAGLCAMVGVRDARRKMGREKPSGQEAAADAGTLRDSVIALDLETAISRLNAIDAAIVMGRIGGLSWQEIGWLPSVAWGPMRPRSARCVRERFARAAGFIKAFMA